MWSGVRISEVGAMLACILVSDACALTLCLCVCKKKFAVAMGTLLA